MVSLFDFVRLIAAVMHARLHQGRYECDRRVTCIKILHKDCITTSCCRNRFDVSCSVMFVVAIIFFFARHDNDTRVDITTRRPSTVTHHWTTRRRLDCGYRFDSTKCFVSGVFPRGSNNPSLLGRSHALMIATRRLRNVARSSNTRGTRC